VVDQVAFLPDAINGRARERDWLWNMGDWMISKKRYWGLALPIWVDIVTGDFEVIGGREELSRRAVEGWEQFDGHSPHRPFLDKVRICNPKTGNIMERIPDVGNPWLDAGIVPFSTMGYYRDRGEWAKWFPADFITESFPGQFRNWFYAILAMSARMEGRAPMKVLLGHALVRDQNGEEMHKSNGNSIEFNGAADLGYELFHERDPKLSVTAQAKRDLPPGYVSCAEGEAVIEGKPKPVVTGRYKPIGADVIRWMYFRHNPAVNINIGPGPADEVRARFHLKLWNVYAFFCNYARLDSFDPAQPPLPLLARADIDRWILSELQGLVTTARSAFDEYDSQRFCLAAEEYVDDKLSNWYVRRSRRRFWKNEQGDDKCGAYQTLFCVLVTLAKLIAPVNPFLAESLYQNLVVKTGAGGPASVHLCDYPVPDPSFVESQLSGDVNALLRLTQLGLAARNMAKIKVRQPLTELVVQPRDADDRRAVTRFAVELCDELNVKSVSLRDPLTNPGPLLTVDVRPNMRTLGTKFGAQIKAACEALSVPPAPELVAKARGDAPFALGGFTFDPADVVVAYRAPEGYVGIEDGGTQIAIDARLTDELRAEGLGRDVVRHVQTVRKESGLEMEDRIVLFLGTESPLLRGAIDTHRDTIARETLTAQWATEVPARGNRKTVKVEGGELTIALERACS
jgi:isoleucyl-tRNA synthetase